MLTSVYVDHFNIVRLFNTVSLHLVRPCFRIWAHKWTGPVLEPTGCPGRSSAQACTWVRRCLRCSFHLCSLQGQAVGWATTRQQFLAHLHSTRASLYWFFSMISSLTRGHLGLDGTEAENQFLSGQLRLLVEHWLLLDCTGWSMSDLTNYSAIWFFFFASKKKIPNQLNAKLIWYVNMP